MLSIDTRAKTAAPARWTRPALLALILAALLAALLLAGGGVFAPPANALVDGDSRGSGPGDFLPGPSGQGGGPGSPEDCEDDPEADCEVAAQGGAVGQGAQAQSTTVALAATEIADTWAWLEVTGHNAQWYYKESQSTNTCDGNTTLKSATVDDLTPGTEYTYKAYSNNTCTTQLSNSVTFTTAKPALVARHVNDTTATLTLRHHNTGNGVWYYQASAGPDSSCSEALDTANAFLTGLSPSVSYTYTAYSDSACNTQLDAATFTTFTTLAAPLPECDHLTLDRHIFVETDRYQFHYIVGNRTDEPLTNVKADFRVDSVINDVRTRGSSNWYPARSANVYVLDGVKMGPGNFMLLSKSSAGATNDRALWRWETNAERAGGDKAEVWHWLMNLPAGSSSAVQIIPNTNYSWGHGNRRFHVTVEHGAPQTGEPFCRTERVDWLRGSSNTKITPMSQDYQVAGITADDHYPAAGGAVNFTVSVDGTGGVFNLNARVRHTPGLEFQTGQSPVITPAPASPRTEPLGVWRNYDAASGTGDFYIGTEDRYERRVVDGHHIDYPPYTITLPLKLKSDATASGQCVTVTATASPEAPRPYRPGPAPFDDPSDNTQTLCLGQPPTAELPVLFSEGLAQLFTLYGCVGKTDYPCGATDTVEQVVGGRDAAVNAGMPYQYFQPEDVIVHIPDQASRNKPTGETGIFWWSGSEEGSQGKTYHPGQLPGVAVRTYFECLTDKDPNNSPNDDPEYKGWKFSIANITDSSPGQGNTIDHTPGAMIIGSLLRANDRTRTYVDVDAMHGNRRTEVEFATYKLCTRSIHLIVEFDQLGTYKADLTQQTKYQDATPAYSGDTGRYTFHVGPVAELSVADRGPVPAVASGQAAYTLDLVNRGPNPSAAAKVVVELPAGATGVTTVPANLGTFLAADANATPARANAYWTWDAGKMPASGFSRGAGLPQNRAVSLIVSGVTSGDATATVSNGNGSCSVGSTTLTYVIREADCDGVTGATWTAANPYTVCINTGNLADVTPKPASKTDCETGTSNKWYEGTVLDHRQGNNTATLAARTGGAGLSGASASNPSMVLNWPAAAGALEYRVFRSPDGKAGSYRQIARVGKDTLTYTDEAVSNGVTYHYQVEALYASRMLADVYAGPLTATLKVSTPRAPGSVSGLTAARQSNNDNAIDVTWTAPSNATAATRYDVQYQSRTGNSGNYGDWTAAATEQGGLAYTITGAGGGTSYRIQVRAVNVVGTGSYPGGWSTASVSPLANPKLVGSLTAARDTGNLTNINVTWNPPSDGTTPTSYEVEYRENGVAWPNPPTDHGVTYACDTNSTPVCSFQLTGAAGASTYQFRVRTVTVSGNDTIYGIWNNSSTVSRVSAPNQVTGLTAGRKSDDETKIDVSWTAPSSGTTPTGYDVEYKQNGASDWTTGATVDHPTVTHTFTVAGGSSYQYRVRAFRTLTTTSEKLAGSWTTSSTVRALPAGPVTNLAATRNTTDATTIDVSWSASNRANGYDVQYRKNSGSWQWAVRASDQTAITENPTETFNYTQTDAGGVESYTFRVRGVSGVGNGDWAESGTVAPPPVGYHGAEVGPQVADGKMAWIKLKVTSGPWSFEYRNHLGDWSSCKNVASGSYTISNLRAPHQHIVEVFDGNGCSDAAKITRTNVYTIDVQDPILDGADFNYHTHKRPYPSMGEVGVKPSDCLSIEQHSHGWPGGGGGTHWHCPIYNAGSSSGASGQSGQPSGGATGQTGQTAGGATGQTGQTGQTEGGAQGQTSQPSGSSQGEAGLTGLAAVMAAINAYFNGTGTLAEAYAALQSYYG